MRRLLSLAALFFWISAAAAQGIAPLPLKIGGQYTGGCGISRPLPGDATTITWSAGGDVCALKQSWCNGKPLFDIIIGAATITINSVNCFPDVRKLAGYLGISPVFGTAGAPLSKLYDQLGGTTGFVQTTAANRPAIWLINGRVSMAYDGFLVDYASGVTVDKFLNFPSITTDNQNTTVFATIQSSSSTSAFGLGGAYSTLFATSPAGATGFSFLAGGGGWSAFSWVSFSGPTSTLWMETQPAIIGAIAGSSAFLFTQNEESNSQAAVAAGTSTGGTLGALNFFAQKSGFYGRMYGFMIAGAANATSGQQTAIRNAFYGLHGIARATAKYNILVDGASLDAGAGSLVGGINGWGWVEQMLTFLRYPIRMGNSSVYGATIANLTTTIATFQCNFFQAGVTNVLIGPAAAAGNSISGGRTGAQAFADLQAHITAYKACANAPTIFLVDLFGDPGPDAYRDYDVLVLANAASMGLTTYSYGNGGYLSPPMAAFQTGNAQYFNQSPAWLVGHPNIVGYHDWFLPPLAAIRSALGP